MKISEFLKECHEYVANEQFVNSNFAGRSVPENTRPELGIGQSHVWQQGLPYIATNEEVVRMVASWTTGHQRVSTQELIAAYSGRSYEDVETGLRWTKRTKQ